MNDKPKRVMGVLFLTVFLDIVGFSIIFPLFPDMLEYYFDREGGAGLIGTLMENLQSITGGEEGESGFRAQVLFGGLLGTLYSALQFIFAPIWGGLSDRRGRKPVLLLTISGLALSYVLWFFSGTFLLLILARLLGGAMAGNIVVASAAVIDTTDAKSRAKGMGIIGAALGLGFICGPAIGGALALVDLTEYTESPGINPFSVPAAGAFLLALWNLLWVKSKFSETLSPENRGKAATVERTNNPLKLFRRYEYPGVNRTNLAYFIFFLAFSGMEFTLTFLAKDRFDYTRSSMVWIFVYIGLILVLVQGGIVRRVAPKYGEKKVSLAGLILVAAGMLLTGLSAGQAGFYGGLALLAVGSGLAIPSLASLVSLYAPDERQGEVQGVFRSLGALARAVGPIVACAVYWEYGPVALYVACAMVLVPALAMGAGLPRVEKAQGS